MRPRLAVLLLVAVLGCSSPVTLSNFEKIEVGMTLQEVEAILGAPDQSYQGVVSWNAGPNRNISIVLDDRGLVAQKTIEGLE